MNVSYIQDIFIKRKVIDISSLFSAHIEEHIWSSPSSDHFPPGSQGSLGRGDGVRSGYDLGRERKYGVRRRKDSLVKELRYEWKIVRGPALLVRVVYAGKHRDIGSIALNFHDRQSRNSNCLLDTPFPVSISEHICLSTRTWVCTAPDYVNWERGLVLLFAEAYTLLHIFGSEVWTGLCMNTSDSQVPSKVVLNCSFRVHLE